MKTEMMGSKRSGVFSKGLVTALLALPLGIVASCAAEPEQTTNDPQALAGDCVLKHPYPWTVGGHHCIEATSTHTQTVANGDTVEMEAVFRRGISGDGFAIVGCVDGQIVKTGTVNGQPLMQTCSQLP